MKKKFLNALLEQVEAQAAFRQRAAEITRRIDRQPASVGEGSQADASSTELDDELGRAA